MPMAAILFDSRFPDGFDLGDPWPDGKEFWQGGKYVGPSFDDCLFPATWATRIGVPKGKGRPPIFLREEFAKERFWVTKPGVFAHEDHIDRLWNEKEFNRKVRPFSDSANTAALLINYLPAMCDTVTYDPGRKSGLINVGGQRLLNTFRGTTIVAVKGDPAQFLDYMAKLIPDPGDRHETLRWVATHIVRLAIRMSYGMLLVSETQGVGQGTLGEAILMPLIGIPNVSVPDEQMITDGSFNGWIAHRRLAVVHEIYAGHSIKAYNRLKHVITDGITRINRKNMEEYELEIWVHIVACSNSLKALKMDNADRRWLVPRVTEVTQPEAYWRKFHGWLKNEDGLGIIKNWAEEFLKTNEPVLKGQHAPWTTRKQELIEEGTRALAERIAAEAANEKENGKDGKIIIAVEDVRCWAADTLGLNANSKEWKLDDASTKLKKLPH